MGSEQSEGKIRERSTGLARPKRSRLRYVYTYIIDTCICPQASVQDMMHAEDGSGEP